MPEMIGRNIAHFEVLEQIGEGGMGVVYRAHDTKLDRTVALKFLPRQSLNDEERERFLREARAAASLDHPNICTIYEIAEAEGHIFFSMAYVEGPTLAEKIQSGPLEIDQALNLAMQIAGALEEAHRREIVHRDIKSQNVIVTPTGRAIILDFGLAQVKGKSRLTREGSTLGTAAYMSPEQTLGEEVDARTDIWSTGVVLYEMLTGQLPFDADYQSAILYAVLNKTPKPLEELRPDAPEELQTLVSRALAKKKDDRYPTVAEFKRELQRLKWDLEDHSGEWQGPAAIYKQRGSGDSSMLPDPVRTSVGKSPEIVQSDHAARIRLRTTPTPGVAILRKTRLRILWAAGSAIAVALAIAAVFTNGRGPAPESAPPKALVQRSVAVMPFVNRDRGGETEYFSDGVTEDLISALGRVEGLKVVARSAAFRFKGKDYDVRDVGKQLSVGTILEGSVRQAEGRLRLTAQLVSVEDGFELWSETFDREVEDIFELQEEISRSIATALEIRLVGDGAKFVTARTENSEAYEAYLRGRYYWNQRTPASVTKAREYFEQAIEQDKEFALAYTGLADSYVAYYGGNTWREAYEQARRAATRALELDAGLAEAHTSLAHVVARLDFDFEAAEQSFLRAIELNPNYLTARQWYTHLLSRTMRIDEALNQIQKARELDPLSPAINSTLAAEFYKVKRYDEAADLAERTLELYPNYITANYVLAFAYSAKGMFPESIEAARKTVADSGDEAVFGSVLGYAYAKAGKRNEARRTLDNLLERRLKGEASSCDIAFVHAALGELEQAMDWLERALEERDYDLLRFPSEPGFSELHPHPRFISLMKTLGLDPSLAPGASDIDSVSP